MNLQRVCIKLFTEPSVDFDDGRLIEIFHDWIRAGTDLGTLIDVADYRHVPGGPGVMLITHEGNFALDRCGWRRGLLYQRKTALPGDLGQRLAGATRFALAACRLLQGEARLGGALVFSTREVLIVANDRLLAPNTDDAYRALEPHLRFLGDVLYGDFDLQRVVNDPHERLAARLTTGEAAPAIDDLLGRLRAVG